MDKPWSRLAPRHLTQLVQAAKDARTVARGCRITGYLRKVTPTDRHSGLNLGAHGTPMSCSGTSHRAGVDCGRLNNG